MKLVAHISDLHFGAHDPRIAVALLVELNAMSPALVAISGDLTQRARRSQFRHAHDWLAHLQAPWLAVPGNHDVPLYDVIRRFVAPRTRYLTSIETESEPWFADDELAVCGIDTTKTFTTKYGHVTCAQARHVATRFQATPRRWRIVVGHHPLIVPPELAHDRAAGAKQALAVLEEAGVDLILSGHLHRPHTEARAGRSHMIIAAHAGTAISTRLRGEPNGYNQLRFDGEMVTITNRAWNGHAFVDSDTTSYVRGARLESPRSGAPRTRDVRRGPSTY